MNNPSEGLRLVVIGAGSGGYAAAFLAADLGMSVTLIDAAPLAGGVCLHRGCIPSKALLHVADVMHQASAAADMGVSFAAPSLDLDRLRSWKAGVIEHHAKGLMGLAEKRGVRYVQGRARFSSPTGLSIAGTDGAGDHELDFDHAIIATGSVPSWPGMFPPVSSRIMDSTRALDLEDIPGRLLVVGGGYIGLELGQAYAALGSRVTVVELTQSLLPGVDKDLVRPLSRRLDGQCESIRLETKLVDIKPMDSEVVVRLAASSGETEERFDKLLVSVGRRPNTAGLGLENTSVELDEAGFVRVDAQRRSREASIWAVGDVAGQPMLAHKAFHEGRLAVQAIAGDKVAYDPAAMPAVVFTDPEIAWCGLTESEAKASGRDVSIARMPWAASGRASTLGRTDGLTKLVIEPETERLLGVGITGHGAGELIAEGVVAIEMGAVARDLELSIHPHPTLSETLMEAAQVFYGQGTHIHRPRRS